MKVVKPFTGLKINHLVVIDFANFPKFIDDIGGVNVKTGRICSTICGGAAKGGFTLNLKPGVHHLDGATRWPSPAPARTPATRPATT